LLGPPAAGAEYLQIAGVIHVHSTFSSGKYSLPDLVAMASLSGVEVLALTDHDRVAMEYGLAPFRDLIRVRKELPSVLRAGVRDYLAQIHSLNISQKEVILLPGVQSSPFYYWTGTPFTGDLTAHDYRKELIAVGMVEATDYENLPVPHKNAISGLFAVHLISWIGAAAFLAAAIRRYRRKRSQMAVMVAAVAAILFMITCHPFRGSGYDPYHGSRDEAPYQDYIDYVQSRGGMVFWCHPESNYSANGRQLGPIQLQTKQYPQSLVRTRGYTGFAAIYGDTARAHNPGMHWDETLLEYCAGFRDKPVWAIAEADFHGFGRDEALDSYQTIFLAREKARSAIMEAMARGRMYAVLKQNTAARPLLDDFRARETGGRSAVAGECLIGALATEITGRISTSDNRSYETEVKIIKNGQVLQVINGRTPLEFHVVDNSPFPGKSFFRLEARLQNVGRIISNPIFVECASGITVARNDNEEKGG